MNAVGYFIKSIDNFRNIRHGTVSRRYYFYAKCLAVA